MSKNKGIIADLIVMLIFLLTFFCCIIWYAFSYNEKSEIKTRNDTKLLLLDTPSRLLTESCYTDNYASCSMNQTIAFGNLKGENCANLFNRVVVVYESEILPTDGYFLGKKETMVKNQAEFYLPKMIDVVNKGKCADGNIN